MIRLTESLEIRKTVDTVSGMNIRCLLPFLLAGSSIFAGSGSSWEDPIIVGPVAQDAFGWRATISLQAVALNEAGDYLTFPYSKSGGFESANIASTGTNMSIGNVWLIQDIGGVYYATVFDYLRPPAQNSKKFPESLVGAGHLVSPMSYRPGQTYGLMVTTLARRNFRTTNERSNIILFEMPLGALGEFLNEQIDGITNTMAGIPSVISGWEFPLGTFDEATQTWVFPDGEVPDASRFMDAAEQCVNLLGIIASEIQGKDITVAKVLNAQATEVYTQYSYCLAALSDNAKYTMPEYTGDDSQLVNSQFEWDENLKSLNDRATEYYSAIANAWADALVAGMTSLGGFANFATAAAVTNPSTFTMPDNSKPFSILEPATQELGSAYNEEPKPQRTADPKKAKNAPQDAIQWEDVIFIGKHADPKVSTYSVTSELISVEPRKGDDFTDYPQWVLDVQETGSDKWKTFKVNKAKLSGNLWIFVPAPEGKWYALPFEVFVTGLNTYPARNLNNGNYSVLENSELSYPWKPRAGQTYGWMISTNAGLVKGKNGTNRSNIILSEWPELTSEEP